MDVQDKAFILTAKPYGERAYVVTLFGEGQGKLRSLWRGSKKNKAMLDPLTEVDITLRRRLHDQLGTAQLELVKGYAHSFFHDETRLAVLHYLSEVLSHSLADEEPHPVLFNALENLLKNLATAELWAELVRFECILLAELGYALTLDPAQAVRAHPQDVLTYLSPKSGRAVGAEMGAAYKDKLLKLPQIFGGPTCDERANYQQAFIITGTFLAQVVPMQKLHSRQRLLDLGSQKGFTAC